MWLLPLVEHCAVARLVDGFFGAAGVAFAAQLALGRGCTGTLFVRTRFGLGLRDGQPLLREAGWHCFAGAAGPFGATLAAIALPLVSIAFARPLVFHHAAIRTKWLRNS